MGPNRADLGNLGSVGAGSDGIGAIWGHWGQKLGENGWNLGPDWVRIRGCVEALWRGGAAQNGAKKGRFGQFGVGGGGV